MGWPAPDDVVLDKNESRRRLYRNRRDALKREIAELRERKEKRERRSSVDPTLDAIVDLLTSQAFDDWYQALTGESSVDWVNSVLNVSPKFLHPIGMTMVEWIEFSYKNMVHKHRMRHSGYKLLVAEEIRNCKDSHRRRRLQQRLATPRWADPSEIAKIYRQRDRLNKQTGVAHEVDHIVPIQHPLVCGLHVEHNLRVITKTRNQAKLNHFMVD